MQRNDLGHWTYWKILTGEEGQDESEDSFRKKKELKWPAAPGLKWPVVDLFGARRECEMREAESVEAGWAAWPGAFCGKAPSRAMKSIYIYTSNRSKREPAENYQTWPAGKSWGSSLHGSPTAIWFWLLSFRMKNCPFLGDFHGFWRRNLPGERDEATENHPRLPQGRHWGLLGNQFRLFCFPLSVSMCISEISID